MDSFVHGQASPARFGIGIMVIAAALLAGCGGGKLPLNYSPSSVMTVGGSATVGSFRYAPYEQGTVKRNQIRNTAIGSIVFESDVDQFFRDAVFKELRFVGVRLDNPDLVIGGDIEEFLIDDLGYSIDWTLKVRYVVTDKTGTLRYEDVHTTQRKTAKFANVFGALNETIKFNIEEMMKDPAFLKAIR